MKELISAFRDLKDSPRAFWMVIFAFAVDAMAYFGCLTLMVPFIHGDLGLSDGLSGATVSVFTGLVTLFMLGVGSQAEKLGVRKGLMLALAMVVVGRFLYVGSPFAGGGRIALLLFSLLVVAAAEGIVQPLCYAGVKQYTSEKTNSMGYALLYAMMNFGIVIAGLVSPMVRVPFDARAKAGASALSGINAANVAFWCVAVLCLTVFSIGMSKRAESKMIRPLGSAGASTAGGLLTRLKVFFLGTPEQPSPFRDARFVFFIFMLLPVRTLFAHQWLTVPTYVLRAFPQEVADKMEWIVNWVNPGIIFVGVPTITAFTRKYHVYTMMIVGTAVSAIPTFLLCAGPSLSMLILYLVIFSIGEAIWSARYYEYASELAPEGRVAQYMGLALIPWLLAKTTTGLYSGTMLARYVPEHGPQNTETLWFIYGVVALVTPIGLLLARRWVMKGMKTKPAPAPVPDEAATAAAS